MMIFKELQIRTKSFSESRKERRRNVSTEMKRMFTENRDWCDGSKRCCARGNPGKKKPSLGRLKFQLVAGKGIEPLAFRL